MDKVLHRTVVRLPPNNAVVELSTVQTRDRVVGVVLQLPAGWVLLTPRAAHQLGGLLMAEAHATATMAQAGAAQVREALAEARQATLPTDDDTDDTSGGVL